MLFLLQYGYAKKLAYFGERKEVDHKIPFCYNTSMLRNWHISK
jgi:hypothetical protein